MITPPPKNPAVRLLRTSCKLLAVPIMALIGLTGIWLAFGAADVQAQVAATVDSENSAPSLLVTHTVGLDATGCATERAVDSLPGRPVFFCLTLENTGDAVFTTHVILRKVMHSVIRNETYTLTAYTLEPGKKLELTNGVLVNVFGFGPHFRMDAVSIETPVFVTVTSSGGGVSATAISSATVHPPPHQLYLPMAKKPSIAEQRQMWRSNNLETYQFEEQIGCFCPPPLVGLVSVQNNQIASVRDPHSGSVFDESAQQRFKTIEELFETLTSAEEEGSHVIDVTWDGDLGYPSNMFIDYNELVADDEIRYQVQALATVMD